VDVSILGLGVAIGSFFLGYSFKRSNLKWQNQAKKAERQAKLQTEQLRATVTASLDGIIVIDADGKVIDFSEAAEKIFGYKKENVLGKSMAKLIVPERYRDGHNAGMKRMRQTGEAKILGQRIEIEAMRADGSEFMSELAVSRSAGENGNIFIAYIRDISEAKAAQQALVEAKESAEKASLVKSRFLAAMSHEIRTPFNAVLGLLDVLGETKLNKDQRHLVKTAEKSSLSLLRIINDVLDYARISSGKYTMIDTVFPANGVFEDVKQLFEVKAREKDLELNTEYDVPENLYLKGDLGRIRQILLNFVSNALKFTEAGEINLRVSVDESGQEKPVLKFEVEDTGIGISEPDLAKLFEEFFMVDSSDSRSFEGTGLGLTISKTISKMLGGEIGAFSELDKGSTFFLTVPLERANKEMMATRYNRQSSDISDVRILLAEDNKTNQMVVSRVLRPRCKNLMIVENGEEVLTALEQQEFDVILMDIFMPKMSGKVAAATIRKSDKAYKNIPIIALTAMGSFHELQGLKDVGMNNVITKPFKRDDLLGTIASIHTGNAMTEFNQTGRVSSALEELFGEVSEEELQTFKNQFHLDLGKASAELSDAVKSEDMAVAIRPSHTMKGLAATYGLTELSKLAELTHKFAKNQDAELFRQQAEKTINLAEQHLANLDALFELQNKAA